jgi:hypothetical protein
MSSSSILARLDWLKDLAFSTEMRESSWLFPTIETVHVFSLALVVGSISMVDLRLLGLVNRDQPYSRFAREILPWTWIFFALAATAGLLMFVANASVYLEDTPFRIKMAGLLLAGLNMSWFHLVGKRNLRDWDTGTPPLRARLAGAASLFLWTVIVAAGRWIGFTT